MIDAEVLEIGHLRDCNGKGHSFLRDPGSVKARYGPKSASIVAGPGLEDTSVRRDG